MSYRSIQYRAKLFILLSLFLSTLEALAEDIRSLTLLAVKDYYPFYSHNGKKITFFSDRSGQYQIYIMNADGSDLTQLTHTDEANETPVFSPDDSKIYFQSHRDGNAEIYVMDVNGNNLVNLTNHPASDSHPKLSANGKRIIFDRTLKDSGFEEVFEMDVNGENLEQKTQFNEIDSYASISPNGEQILWRRILSNGGDKDISASGRNSEIFIMNRDGSHVKNLSNNSAFDGYPFFSPDGQEIVFSSTRDRLKTEGDVYDSNIYVMNIDGSDVRRLTDTIPYVEQVRPMWSHDGKKIIFNRDNIHEKSDVTGVKFFEIILATTTKRQ